MFTKVASLIRRPNLGQEIAHRTVQYFSIRIDTDGPHLLQPRYWTEPELLPEFSGGRQQVDRTADAFDACVRRRNRCLETASCSKIGETGLRYRQDCAHNSVNLNWTASLWESHFVGGDCLIHDQLSDLQEGRVIAFEDGLLDGLNNW